MRLFKQVLLSLKSERLNQLQLLLSSAEDHNLPAASACSLFTCTQAKYELSSLQKCAKRKKKPKIHIVTKIWPQNSFKGRL